MEQLGKFGHHPDPLTDAQIEVDRLQGHLTTARNVLEDALNLDLVTEKGQRFKTNVRWALGELGDEDMRTVAPIPASNPPAAHLGA